MTCSLTIDNKKTVTFKNIKDEVADVFYNFVKKGKMSRGDMSIKLTNTYSKKINGEYVDLKTFYKENDIEPFSDKKFSYWTKTDVSVTLYNERIVLLSDGYKEPFNYPVIEMNMDFYTKEKDSLGAGISALFKEYDKYSQNIVCEYDEEWYKNDFQIEDKKINHLLMFVYQKGKNLQKELDASYDKLSKALEKVGV